MKNNDLFRASGIMAIGTILSRITGFFRAILVVAVLGTALLADSYNVANTMPNILYNLLVGGALTAIFVPQLVRSFSDADGGHGFASRLVTTISGLLFLLVIVGVVFAPALVRLYAPDFASPGFEKEFSIAISFTRYCLPQIFFLGLFTMLGQVANARGSFAPLMWAPIANNLVVIAVFSTILIMQKTLTVESISQNQIQLLGIGTTLGIIIQALILIPVVKRSGIRLRPILGVAGLGKSFSLAGWTLVYVFISQLGYLITVNVATSAAVRSAQAGITTGVGFTPFTSAYYIMLLPYSIVTISIVTALLPHLSKLAIEKNSEEVKKQLVRAIRMCGVVTVPSSIAFLLFGSLMTEVLYFGISLDDSRYIGYVLSALSFGLVAFSINLVLIRGFNAFEDTRTQVLSILIINIISSALSYLFLATLKSEYVTIGLGLAFAISYIFGLFVTIYLLRRHIGRMNYSHFLGQHLRLYAASLLAMLPFFAITYLLNWNSDDAPALFGLLRLAFVLIGGGVTFVLIAHAFKITEMSTLKDFAVSLFKKRRSSRQK
ncbi:MAG: murein biosynthesis integral membrane protein MurJ [Candidatus Planktophila sp.]|jgi:putative peptidoglycan lipid II flippase|tara:strand:- start:13660 stop:15303 length:1644 start_codon:yes stop_codon:yes gene_type:complete